MIAQLVEQDEKVLKPRGMPARTLRLSNNPAIIAERGSCTESDLKEVSTQFRH